jgi:hypothetical protein
MSLSETSSTGDRGVQDADDPPVVEAGGRIISMRVSGDVVARLQKEVDAGVVPSAAARRCWSWRR